MEQFVRPDHAAQNLRTRDDVTLGHGTHTVVDGADARAADAATRRGRSRWMEQAQFRLELGAVDDPEEAAADRVAEQVLRRIGAGRVARLTRPTGHETSNVATPRGPATRILPATQPEQSGAADPAPVPELGSGRVRRSRAGDASSGRLDDELAGRVQRARSDGHPLPGDVRQQMEYGFGADLSGVRVHTGHHVDALNERLGAKAFTVGNDVFFRGGLPNAADRDGSRLIAHELAHTFQQGAVRRRPVVRRKGGKKKSTGNFWTDLHQEIDAKGEALQEYVAKQFGAKGMPKYGIHKRSSEARAWRADIKTEARAQARADVDTALEGRETDDGNNKKLLNTEKAFYRLKAKKKVYSEAKKSVNTAINDAAGDVLDVIWTAQSTTIFNAAVRAYMDHLADLPEDYTGAQSKARRVIEERFQQAKDDARTGKRIVFGKEAADDTQSDAVTSTTQTMDKGEMTERAKTQVSDIDKVGEKAVQETIESDSVEQGMGVLGKLLDHVVGSSGDQVSLSIEFKVPIDPSGVGYVAFTLTGKAARGIDGAMTAGVPVLGDPRRLEVMAEFTFRLGAGIADVLDIGANFKIFARGGANDTELCMKALSYGAYRRLGAVSETAANWWSGADSGLRDTPEYQTQIERRRFLPNKKRGAGTGVGGKAHYAESWAAMVEEQAFKKGGAFVDVGGGIGASGEVSLGDDLFGGIGLEGGLSAFHRYDDAALEKSLGDAYGTVVADKNAAKKRRKDVSGSFGAAYSVSGKAKFNVPNGPSIEVAGSVSGSLLKPAAFGIEITGTIGYSGDNTSQIERWAAGYATAVADLLKSFPKLAKSFFHDRHDAGLFTEAIATTTQAVNAGLENTVTDGLSRAWEVAEGPASGAAGLVTSSSLQVALIGGCDGEKPIFRIEIRSGRKLEINTPMAGAAGVKISAEKTSRVLALGVEQGKDGRMKADMEILGARMRGKTNQRGTKSRL